MINTIIDLRSDTVTKPTDEMRKAMADAEVGDDVFGDDPTVKRLEELAAETLGKEAALFTASGTMSNLIVTLTHCDRGDEVIMGRENHMFWNEAGGGSALAGIQVHVVPNDDQGRMDPSDVSAAIRPKGDHFPRTSLLCIENTHNRCNGGVLTAQDTQSLVEAAHAGGILVHLDGARIFNAAVCLESPAKELARDVDDVCFCISKGLSAPVGSLLCGTQDFIDRARRWRKMVGGGMRQAGIIAAAGIVALKTMVDRLAEDHAHARQLADGLANIPGLHIDPQLFQTNIVMVDVDPSLCSVPEFIGRLAQLGVKVTYPGGGRFRMVTHRHITSEDVTTAVDLVASTAKSVRAAGSG